MQSKIISTSELRDVLDRVTFSPSCVNLDWKWKIEDVVNPNQNAVQGLLGWLVSTTFRRPDIDTDAWGEGEGRQEFVPYGSSETRIVMTCWLLAKLIVEHELMESFHFRGAKILNPHHTVDELSLPHRSNQEKHGLPGWFGQGITLQHTDGHTVYVEHVAWDKRMFLGRQTGKGVTTKGPISFDVVGEFRPIDKK